MRNYVLVTKDPLMQAGEKKKQDLSDLIDQSKSGQSHNEHLKITEENRLTRLTSLEVNEFP